MPQKKTTPTRRTSGRRKTIVARKRPNVLIRLLQHLPGWAWWAGGGAVVAVYVYFFYYIFVGPFGLRWRALYGDVSYPEGYEIHGIDISHHQGRIDWDRLRDEGSIDRYPVRFVMIKATEGATRVDDRFRENFRRSREYGFIRGAYHFYSVQTSALDQARFFIRNVQLEDGDLPPVLDVEHKPRKQSPEEFRRDVLLWLQTVEQHYGVKPVIYTYYKFKTKYLSDPAFDAYPYWIAHYYVDRVEYGGEWRFWQHTDAGTVAGIKGYVDFNIFNGSIHDLVDMTIGVHKHTEGYAE